MGSEDSAGGQLENYRQLDLQSIVRSDSDCTRWAPYCSVGHCRGGKWDGIFGKDGPEGGTGGAVDNKKVDSQRKTIGSKQSSVKKVSKFPNFPPNNNLNTNSVDDTGTGEQVFIYDVDLDYNAGSSDYNSDYNSGSADYITGSSDYISGSSDYNSGSSDYISGSSDYGNYGSNLCPGSLVQCVDTCVPMVRNLASFGKWQ